jgi:hypothetical protein
MCLSVWNVLKSAFKKAALHLYWPQKMYKSSKGIAQFILDLDIRLEWSASRFGRFSLEENAYDTQTTRCLLVSGAGPHVLEKSNLLPLTEIKLWNVQPGAYKSFF